MKWVRDTTGRFLQRPYYEQRELDNECEDFVTSFLLSRYGKAGFPISTEDLTVLLESVTSDLDMGADLSTDGEDVEGVTEFLPNVMPRVRLARALSDDHWRENRLRTTLTHELGHVKFHNFHQMQSETTQPSLFDTAEQVAAPRCRRASIIGASKVDWMEWQAGYASGAFLMPFTLVRQLVQEFIVQTSTSARANVGTEDIVAHVQTYFRVSRDAARVRLSQLNYLNPTGTLPLF